MTVPLILGTVRKAVEQDMDAVKSFCERPARHIRVEVCWRSRRPEGAEMRTSLSAHIMCLTLAAVLSAFTAVPVHAQSPDFTPVADAMLRDPAPEDWLMWRGGRSTAGATARWTRSTATTSGSSGWSGPAASGRGLQQGTPLVYDGVMYMPNPRDVIQALDAVTGDVRWEYRRDRPDDLEDYMLGALTDLNRNLAIYGTRTSSTPAATTTSSRSTRPPASWPGRRRSSTTASIPPTRGRARSSPTGK